MPSTEGTSSLLLKQPSFFFFPKTQQQLKMEQSALGLWPAPVNTVLNGISQGPMQTRYPNLSLNQG